jgi:hypothetical protein
MVQQGQVFQLTRCGPDGEPLWAFRYRTGGRDAKRIQRGGFASEQDAREWRGGARGPRPRGGPPARPPTRAPRPAA